MTKEQMRKGFLEGRGLIQEEWANQDEIRSVDELVAEGVAVVVVPWEYKDGFQCRRRGIVGTNALKEKP